MAKDKVKADMARHANEKDRFTALWQGILDDATELVSRGASKEEQLAAIQGLRGQVDEAYDDMKHGRK